MSVKIFVLFFFFRISSEQYIETNKDEDYVEQQNPRTLGTNSGPTLISPQNTLKGFEPIYISPDLEDILDQQQFNVYHEPVHGTILMPRISFSLNDDQPFKEEDYSDYLNLVQGVDPKYYGRKRRKSSSCGPGCVKSGSHGSVKVFPNPLYNPTIEEMIPFARIKETPDTYIVMADDPVLAVDSVPKCSKNTNTDSPSADKTTPDDVSNQEISTTGEEASTSGGDSSTTEGESSTTGGESSTTEGESTTTGGDSSTTGGDSSTTGGDSSTTGGDSSTTGGDSSTTGGDSSTVSSTEIGESTTAGGARRRKRIILYLHSVYPRNICPWYKTKWEQVLCSPSSMTYQRNTIEDFVLNQNKDLNDKICINPICMSQIKSPQRNHPKDTINPEFIESLELNEDGEPPIRPEESPSRQGQPPNTQEGILDRQRESPNGQGQSPITQEGILDRQREAPSRPGESPSRPREFPITQEGILDRQRESPIRPGQSPNIQEGILDKQRESPIRQGGPLDVLNGPNRGNDLSEPKRKKKTIFIKCPLRNGVYSCEDKYGKNTLEEIVIERNQDYLCINSENCQK